MKQTRLWTGIVSFLLCILMAAAIGSVFTDNGMIAFASNGSQNNQIANEKSDGNIYTYTTAGMTFTSEKSEDDAWYKGAMYKYEQGIMTLEEVEEEYRVFSRKYVTETIAESGISTYSLLGTTTVSGNMLWWDEYGDMRPMRSAKVALYVNDPLEPYRITYTDLYGAYSFSLTNVLVLTVHVELQASGETYLVGRDWWFNDITRYSVYSSPVNVTSSAFILAWS